MARYPLVLLYPLKWQIWFLSLFVTEKMIGLWTVNFDPKKAIFANFEPPGLPGEALGR